MDREPGFSDWGSDMPTGDEPPEVIQAYLQKYGGPDVDREQLRQYIVDRSQLPEEIEDQIAVYIGTFEKWKKAYEKMRKELSGQ